MTRLGMVIDLAKCVGCGACAFACKTENNTRTRGNGQSHNWADFMMHTEGTFPEPVTHIVMPVLCNHCDERALHQDLPGQSGKGRPGKPYKAMFKTPEGITLHNPSCASAAASARTPAPTATRSSTPRAWNGETYSVISLNAAKTTAALLGRQDVGDPGRHVSGRRSGGRAGARTPAMNDWQGGELQPIRKDDVIEKCTFCYHRVTNGLQPACVEVCPSQARIFGDQEDPKSQIAQILKKEKSFRLQEDKGTKPNVHYVGKYSPRA
jgi:Fe-S-cluster-containing dehydrogenase component